MPQSGGISIGSVLEVVGLAMGTPVAGAVFVLVCPVAAIVAYRWRRARRVVWLLCALAWAPFLLLLVAALQPGNGLLGGLAMLFLLPIGVWWLVGTAAGFGAAKLFAVAEEQVPGLDTHRPS